MHKRFLKLPVLLFSIMGLLCSMFVMAQVVNNQKPATQSKPVWVPKPSADKLAIDSLKLVIDSMNNRFIEIDSLFQTERITTADLRKEIIKLDDYRMKLEDHNANFKGENLKLNQSNRILIIFNSMVAILLVITLVFFLRKVGRKKVQESKKAVSTQATPPSEKFASFEDKLVQLERLGKLREKNFLSEDEFITEKQRILGR